MSTQRLVMEHIDNKMAGCEERSPEPKPRWNPKPEQIRILEAIFNSGMVNPPRDEIRKIRAQLQEYGQVGDANVFYWFQNRKSRSKHKQRQLQNSKHHQPPQNPSSTAAAATAITAPSSSSSSSEKSSPKSADKAISISSTRVIDMSNSPTASVNQTYFQTPAEFLPEPYFFPAQQPAGAATTSVFTPGFCFPGLVSDAVHGPPDQTVGNCSGLLLSELMMNLGPPKKAEDEKLKLQQQQMMSYSIATTAPTASQSTVPPSTVTFPTSINHILGSGMGESGTVGPARSTVFINDVAFEVYVGPFNVREAFGDDAVLIHSSGHPVVTNEWGITVQSLQHGGFYYLLRTLTPVTAPGNATDMVISSSTQLCFTF
ncbi:hypothetical protein U1Q18_009250 [Sarracenia purpurea var. burkii]